MVCSRVAVDPRNIEWAEWAGSKTALEKSVGGPPSTKAHPGCLKRKGQNKGQKRSDSQSYG